MKSPLQRKLLIAAALLAPALAACGFSAQTDQVYQAAVGVNDRSGDVEILNAVIVAEKDGDGTFAGTLVNSTDSEQKLVGITGEGVTASLGNVAVTPFGNSNLAAPTTDGGPQVTVKGAPVLLGRFVTLTFAFASGQSTSVRMPVVSDETQDGKEYADVPLPSDRPTASPAASPTATPTAGPTDESTDGE